MGHTLQLLVKPISGTFYWRKIRSKIKLKKEILKIYKIVLSSLVKYTK